MRVPPAPKHVRSTDEHFEITSRPERPRYSREQQPIDHGGHAYAQARYQVARFTTGPFYARLVGLHERVPPVCRRSPQRYGRD